ncbi:MAG: quinolinate synthase NadA [Desulfobacterales bacterium]|nr:quinolinate synthase NadA [Desulfobacterales bacterium]
MKARIKALAEEKNAIILAHNYQPAEIQDLADLCGDSLELSIKASQTSADIIVFCGVHFMAETAAILSPDKTVLLPNPDAGCPMADMVTPEALVQRKRELGNIPVITYVNSSAAVKAVSDVCCTSANVVKVVNGLDAPEVLMTPDRNLARYAAAHTEKKIHLWEGHCPFHNDLTPEEVKAAKAAHPQAEFVAHPECPMEILELAHAIKSTSGMIQYAQESPAKEFILGTEVGILHPIALANPGKTFHPASKNTICADMKRIRPEQICHSLETLEGQVSVPEETRIKALGAVQKMIAMK